MIDITRYDINENGEIPLTYGRYCRWEDVEDLIASLESKIGYGDEAYNQGYDDGYADAREEFEED